MSIEILEAPLTEHSPKALAFILPVNSTASGLLRFNEVGAEEGHSAGQRALFTARKQPVPLWVPEPPSVIYPVKSEGLSPISSGIH